MFKQKYQHEESFSLYFTFFFIVYIVFLFLLFSFLFHFLIQNFQTYLSHEFEYKMQKYKNANMICISLYLFIYYLTNSIPLLEYEKGKN
jgi:flagellar biosynthesis protein FlhB